jgi:hypothetical protein
MAIYIHTEFGRLKRETAQYMHRYNIKTCFLHNSISEIKKCICVFLILDNENGDLDKKSLTQDCVLGLKGKNHRPVIALIYNNDNNLVNYCCRELKVFSFTFEQIEELLFFECKFFARFENLEEQYDIDVKKFEGFEGLYLDEIKRILNKWIKCS